MSLPTSPANPHQQVEDLLPFFVAGTLSPAESEFVRGHLSGCQRCRQSLTEWFEISHAVQAEAEAWGGPLPPLSDVVRAKIARTAVRPQAGWFAPAPDGRRAPSAPGPLPDRRAGRPQRERRDVSSVSSASSVSTGNIGGTGSRRFPLTLVAALVTVLLVAGVFTVSQRPPPAAPGDSTLTLTVRPITATPLVVVQAGSATPTTPTPTLSIPSLVPTTPAPITDLPVLPDLTIEPSPTDSLPTIPPRRVTNTPRPGQPIQPTPQPSLLSQPVQPTPTAEIPPGVCAATNATGLEVPVYGDPQANATIIGNLLPSQQVVVVVQTGTGWYRISSIGASLTGWVRGESLAFQGSCVDLPLPSPTSVPTSVQTACVVIPVNAAGMYLYHGPGEHFGLADTASSEVEYIAVARSDNGWWQVSYSRMDGPHMGWMNGALTSASGNCQEVPVVPLESFATPLPTPTPFLP